MKSALVGVVLIVVCVVVGAIVFIGASTLKFNIDESLQRLFLAFLALLALSPLWIPLLSMLRRKKTPAEYWSKWASFASAHGLSFDAPRRMRLTPAFSDPGMLTLPRLQGNYKGRDIVAGAVDLHEEGSGKSVFSRLYVRATCAAGGLTLTIRPEPKTIGFKLMKAVGANETEIEFNDPEFDNAFFVTANSEGTVKAILDVELRRAILGLLKPWGVHILISSESPWQPVRTPLGIRPLMAEDPTALLREMLPKGECVYVDKTLGSERERLDFDEALLLRLMDLAVGLADKVENH